MHLKANGDVLNYLLFDYSYINEIIKSKIGNMSQYTPESQKFTGLS